MTQAMTEAEARRILAEVEPKHAAWEREYSIFAVKGFVDLRPHLKGDPSSVPLTSWRPRATRTRSGWTVSGGWLGAPVPPLPTRGVPNAGGVSPMMVDPEHGDGSESVWDRHRSAPLFMPRFPREAPYSTREMLEALWRRAERPTESEGAVLVTASQWHRNRALARAWPTLDIARGWCPALSESAEDAERPTKAGWAVMVRALRAEMRETDAAWAAERAELTQRTEAA